VLNITPPILASFELIQVDPHLVALAREPKGNPARQIVVSWRGMANEDNVSRFSGSLFGSLKWHSYVASRRDIVRTFASG
jgi:hypothetical protein